MGSSFIITESMLEKNGRKLMLDFYNHIHDDYCLKTFSEFREQRKYWDENVVDKYKKVVLKDRPIYKDVDGGIIFLLMGIDKDYKKLEGEDLLEYIKDKIKDKTIEIEFVNDFLTSMDEKLNLDSSLEFECNEDLFYLKKAFLKTYDLFYNCGHELKV